MATYYTPIAVGADADADTFNDPMDELDTQIIAHNTEIVAARGSMGSIDARLDTAHMASGAHATSSITLQSQVAMSDAAAVNGDVIRYQEFIAHYHAPTGTTSEFICLFSDRSVSAAADTPAAGLATYERTDDNANLITFITFPLYKRAHMDALILTGKKANTSATLEGTITWGSGATTTTEAVAASQASVAFSDILDISALADDAVHEIAVQMHYAGGVGGATGQIELTLVQVWGAPTAPVPT